MNYIIYIINDKRVMSFSSTGPLYYKIKEIINTNSLKILFDNEKITFCNEIVKVVDDLIQKRKEVKSFTLHKVLYKNQSLLLGRNIEDQEIKICIDLLEFINHSESIEIIELPSFDTEVNDLLLKLKIEKILLEDVSSEILCQINNYNLVDIKGNEIFLKDTFKKIVFFQ